MGRKSSANKLTILRIAARDGGLVCRYCEQELGWKPGDSFPTLDHLVPQSLGGTWHDGNLVLACAPCNSSAENFGKQSYARKQLLLMELGLRRDTGRDVSKPTRFEGLKLGDLLTDEQRRRLGLPTPVDTNNEQG